MPLLIYGTLATGSTTSNIKDPQHTYITGGNYTVTLTSTKGMESTNATKTVTISIPGSA